ncbi:hypothetical protein QWY77_08910 [Thalassotalea ponticola]|uniref:hypothetical protein n=1 Tax=Thalassotalea ponticola TaxID=1523392 RepID=UPI0025B378EA|nr:hypothetical protein [Thalassotalea ponticola]MDN3652882.1 hypothetical protein [Thalassotalea ponticola]
MQKSSIIFGISMFLITGILTYLNLTKSLPISLALIINVLISAVVLAIPSAIAFHFGVKRIGVRPTIPKILMAALFAFFVGNSAAIVFSLREISWFLFAAVVIALSYLAPLGLLKPMVNQE